MVKLAMFTGMRRGEIFCLMDRDLHFDKGVIELKGPDRRGPKGGQAASIPMSPPVAEMLREQLAWRDERHPRSSYVFPGRNGGMRVECRAARRIKHQAGLPKEFRIFHGLRHHFAVTLANSGEYTLDMVGELLTHKSHAMTRRYAKFLPDTIKRASSRAVELLNGGEEGDEELEQDVVEKRSKQERKKR
jgi:integrase